MSENNYSRQYNLEFRKRPDESQVGKLLRGAIDTHVHCSPDLPPMRHNAFEIALDAREAGLSGIVFKTPFLLSLTLTALGGRGLIHPRGFHPNQISGRPCTLASGRSLS
ncbi:MAG: DUF6282 family protein [Dehalococcoidales bacterium]